MNWSLSSSHCDSIQSIQLVAAILGLAVDFSKSLSSGMIDLDNGWTLVVMLIIPQVWILK